MRKNTSKDVFNQEEMGTESKLKGLTIEELVLVGAVERVQMALVQERGDYLEARKHFKLEDGGQAIVGNGFGKPRCVKTPLGDIVVRSARANNKSGIQDEAGELDRFVSEILPPYRRRSLSLEETLPLLYLHGLSMNDFIPALRKMLGEKAAGLSPSTIGRMLKAWTTEIETWKKRDLSDKEYCYIWVDGIYFGSRGESEDTCILVFIGATKDGKKELIMVEGGFRESTESWLSMIRRLKTQGLKAPKLFIGDGAMGFWAAARQAFPGVKEQRCWVHKTKNILDKLPKSQHRQAKSMLHAIYNASSRKEAEKESDRFLGVYDDKYPKATECLRKDREHLLTFYDFPAAHWVHIRTTNPIESSFATSRLRSAKTRGNWGRDMTETMAAKLLLKAESRWKRLRKHKEIVKVMLGVKYIDGLEQAA